MREKIHERGIRIGAFASLLFAIVALLANIILPFVVSGTANNGKLMATGSIHSRLRKPTIIQLWTASHILFAIAMFSTIFVTSNTSGVIVIGCLGLPWALTLWAPFAIIGIEIATIQELHTSNPEDQFGAVTDCNAGVILSLHNIAISAPQIIAALICSGVFWVAHILGSSDVTGWTLRVGGLAALGAALLSRGLSQEICDISLKPIIKIHR